MNQKLVGIVILVAIVLGALSYQFVFRTRPAGTPQAGLFGLTVETLTGYIGSEKANLLDNPKAQAILRSKGGIKVDYQRAGSIEMIGMDQSGKDFLWPSSQVALELYKLRGGRGKTAVALNSPIVFYSWDIVADALVAEGLVENRNGVYYVVKLREMVDHAVNGTTWANLGLPQLFGKFSVISTDPNKSNSGAQFAGLLANILVGDVLTERTLPDTLPKVAGFFERLGLMEHSTGTLFERYITQGVGSYPIIVGYENGIIEFALQNPEVWPKVRDRMRVLYPLPTVWSSHPLIALNAKGAKLIEVVTDKDFQKIAWEAHGFRAGIPGVINDPAVFNIAGLPQGIDQVMPMPTPEIMEKILAAIKGDTK